MRAGGGAQRHLERAAVNFRQVRLRRAHLTSALVMAAVCAIGCSSGDSTRVDDVHRQTIRNGAAATAANEVERSRHGVRFAWDVRLQRTWLEYQTDMVAA